MKTKLGKIFVIAILFLLGAPWVSVLEHKRSRRIYSVLLAGICVVMFYITLFSRSFSSDRAVQLVPFLTFSEAMNILPLNLAPYLKDGKLTLREMLLAVNFSFQFIGLNILLFVPFGYLQKKLFGHKKGVWVIMQGMLFSLLIEVIQYSFCLGWFDIDDVICNTLGTCVGCVSCMATNRLLAKVQAHPVGKNQRKRDRSI